MTNCTGDYFILSVLRWKLHISPLPLHLPLMSQQVRSAVMFLPLIQVTLPVATDLAGPSQRP